MLFLSLKNLASYISLEHKDCSNSVNPLRTSEAMEHVALDQPGLSWISHLSLSQCIIYSSMQNNPLEPRKRALDLSQYWS